MLRHGVCALVLEHRAELADGRFPQPVLAVADSETKRLAAVEMLRRTEAAAVATRLASADIRALFLKGTALAYSLYPGPQYRPRADSDILVPPSRRFPAESVLSAIGYRPAAMIRGELVMNQLILRKTDRLGVDHTIDLHWKLANPHAFANLFTFDELFSRREAVPLLGPDAFTLAPIDALLYACVHRIAHHGGHDRMIWLYDIHTLLAGRSGADWNQIINRAVEKGIGTVCLSGFDAAESVFGTTMPPRARELLQSRIDAGSERSTAAFLARNRRRTDALLSDLRSLTWRGRVRLLREMAFPDTDYMLRRYHASGRRVLPLLYLRRAIGGVARYLRPARGGHGE